MMKLLSILSVFLLCACQQSRIAEVVEINPEHFETQEIVLSDLANEVTYIPLDTAKLFNGVIHCEFSDDFIFICTGDELLKYDHTGKLLQQIGSLGSGPEELREVWNKSMKEDDSEILILAKLK